MIAVVAIWSVNAVLFGLLIKRKVEECRLHREAQIEADYEWMRQWINS
jgi:hypothetical protein